VELRRGGNASWVHFSIVLRMSGMLNLVPQSAGVVWLSEPSLTVL